MTVYSPVRKEDGTYWVQEQDICIDAHKITAHEDHVDFYQESNHPQQPPVT